MIRAEQIWKVVVVTGDDDNTNAAPDIDGHVRLFAQCPFLLLLARTRHNRSVASSPCPNGAAGKVILGPADQFAGIEGCSR